MNVASHPLPPPILLPTSSMNATSQRRGAAAKTEQKQSQNRYHGNHVGSPGSTSVHSPSQFENNNMNHDMHYSPGTNKHVTNNSSSSSNSSTVRRLSDSEVRAIFECLHSERPVPTHLKFQIVPVGSNGLKLSPPSYEFQDGLYVLLRPAKKSRGKHQLADVPKAPAHLQHLVWENGGNGPETCPWSLSGPQFPQPTAIQQRYCYPKGKAEYSSRKGGALWTMYGRDKKEDLDFRLLHVYFSAKRAVNKGLHMAPSAVASAAASSSAAVSSGSPPMAFSASSTPTPASMMATTTPPRPTKRNKQSPDRYYGHHPGVAYHHHRSHSYGNPLQSPAMTTSSVSQSSVCNSPLGFDIRPPSPGRNLLMHQHMPPLEQSNFVTPINDLFLHRFPAPLEDPHYHPHPPQHQQQYQHLYQHQYDHHPHFLHHPYNPSPPPPPPPRRSAPPMLPTPPAVAAATAPPPQAKSTTKGGNRGMSIMTTSTSNASLSPIQGPSPFRRGGGIRDGATTTSINNSGGHLSGIQQSPLRRSIPGKHSFNLDTSSDSRSEAFEMDASMHDIDTDSYWNDPLLAIMLKPSMDRDTLSRSGGELGVSLAAPPLNGLSNLGCVENAASGSASPTRNFHSRLETLQQTIRNVILQAPPTDQSALMAMVTSWANRLSQDPLSSDNTTASITVVQLPKTTLSASVSSASLDTTTSNAREHPSNTQDEQRQADRNLPVLLAAAATMYGNSNDNNHNVNIKRKNNHNQQQQNHHHHHYSTNLEVGSSHDASSAAPTAAVNTGRNDGHQQMSMIVSPTSSAAGATASPSSSPNQMASV